MATGAVIPGAIPLVYFTTEERLNEMIDFCREIGVFVANPHVNNVEGGGRYRADNVQLLAKQRYDPQGSAESRKNDHLSAGSRSTRGAKTMKTWIPDARNFAYLNWKQVDALPRESTLLVLPTAAIEQHGHHLPLATDTLINNLLLGHALAKLPPDLPVYALPPVHYGKSNEHIGFPGTLSVSASTFMAVLRDLGASIANAGFQKARALQHAWRKHLADRCDGPRPARGIRPAHVCAARLAAEFRLKASIRRSAPTDSTREKWKRLFFWPCVPELVDRSAYTANYIADIAKPGIAAAGKRAGDVSHGSRATSHRAACWAIRVRPPRKKARAGWKKPPTRLAAALEAMVRYPDPQRHERDRALVDCGNGVRLERGVRCRMSDGVELVSDHYYPAAGRPASHSADAPALRPRYRFHRGLCASGVVRAAWLQRRDSGCARARRFRAATFIPFAMKAATARKRSPGCARGPNRTAASACTDSPIRA